MSNKRVLAIASLLIVAGASIPIFWPGKGRVVNGQEKTEFAVDRAKEKGELPNFDSDKAMQHLRAICDIGPRQSGAEGMKKQQELIKKHFAELNLPVKMQEFEARQISQPRAVSMANMIVSIFPERNRRVILCSHYDTRPIADQEPDRRKWRGRFVSANDGGSGVALLMELARNIKGMENIKVGVDLVFFDGEEYVFDSDRDRYFFGSDHFAKTWKQSKDRPDYAGAILLDMIAGKNARFPAEGYSYARAEGLVKQVWAIANELECNAFANVIGDHVRDDHLALLNVGIPAIDIIDFQYPHWHKLSDVPENCHPAGMEQVAKVLAIWLQRLK